MNWATATHHISLRCWWSITLGVGHLTGGPSLNPFASIGLTGTSKDKVKVSDNCLNNSFLTWFFSFYTLIWKKSLSSLKKRSIDISLQHKKEASYKFSKKKKLLHLTENRAGGERVKRSPGTLIRRGLFELSLLGVLGLLVMILLLTAHPK